MFVKKEKKESGEKLRTYQVSAPLVTTQHRYEDEDDDLIKQLKIKAAIAEWQLGDSSPSPAMIDNKKHVTEDIKANRKKHKKENNKKKKKDKMGDNTSSSSIVEGTDGGGGGGGEKDQEKKIPRVRHRSNSGGIELAAIITHSIPSNSNNTTTNENNTEKQQQPHHPINHHLANASASSGSLKDLRGSGGVSLIRRATALGTMTRKRVGRDRSRTEANPMILSDPSTSSRLVPVTRSTSSLRDNDDDDEDNVDGKVFDPPHSRSHTALHSTTQHSTTQQQR